jgi:hypothetical protein
MTHVPATQTLRDRLINSAIAAGKFSERSRPQFERMWSKDPTDTAVVIAQIPAGLLEGANALAAATAADEGAISDGGLTVYPAQGGGFARSAPAGEDVGYDASWLTGVERARIEAAEAGRQYSHVVSE